jgi:hypothetical protein
VERSSDGVGYGGADYDLVARSLCLQSGYEALFPPVDDQLVRGPEMTNRAWEV